MNFEDYRDLYTNIRLTRRDGILQIQIHSDGGPAVWGAGIDDLHAELADAFHRIGRDLGNHVVILTGTGDEFITKWDPYPGARDLDFSLRVMKEAKDLIQNLLEIEVPVIGVANGPAFVHPELVTLSDIVIASDRAFFGDIQHHLMGLVPGDGTQVWWEMLLGPNRSRHLVLTGRAIGADEAKELGIVAEVLPHEQALDRAWEVARGLLTQPRLRLRYTRVVMVQSIKRRMASDLDGGLMTEGVAALLAGATDKTPAATGPSPVREAVPRPI